MYHVFCMLFYTYAFLEPENERSNYLLLYMISYPLYYLHSFYLSVYDEPTRCRGGGAYEFQQPRQLGRR